MAWSIFTTIASCGGGTAMRLARRCHWMTLSRFGNDDGRSAGRAPGAPEKENVKGPAPEAYSPADVHFMPRSIGQENPLPDRENAGRGGRTLSDRQEKRARRLSL